MKFSRLGLLATVCVASAASAQGPANESEARNWSGPETVIPTAATATDPVRHVANVLRNNSSWLEDVLTINDTDGTLRGVAPRYEVVFGDRDVDFQPVLGTERPQTETMRFALESVGRANGTPIKAGQGERLVDDLQVRYRRANFDEIYDVRKDAMEQSFEFRSIPSGTGDLIVRVQLATNMVANTTEWTQDCLELRLDGVRGHAFIGKVTGIDANGAKCTGSMRFANGTLELALPERFVESAALPMVLDPFIGSSFEGSLSGTTFDQRTPDVAYDASQDVYLIVWAREVAGTFQIRCRGVRCDGTAVFFTNLNTTSTSKFDPRCANVAREDAFAVVWNESSNIRAGAVETDGTNINPSGIDVRATADLELAPDIGGEATAADNEAIAVWWNLTTDDIEAAQITVETGTTPPTISTFDFTNISVQADSSTFDDRSPSISQSGGSTGFHLITWNRDIGGDFDIRGQVVDRNLGVVENFIAITNNTVQDFDSACDGDGRKWVVAWERDEPTSTVDEDIYAISVRLNTANVGIIGSEVAIESGANDDEQNPAVAWLGESALVGFADEVTAGSNIYDVTVVSVDPFTCERISGEAVPEVTALDMDFVAIASAFSGGSDDDTALVVWDREDNTTFDSTIQARCWDANEGTVVGLGGGCGGGGTAYATEVTQSNPDFTHRLCDATASSACALIFSFGTINAGCGSCTLVPNPITGFGFPSTTDGNGEASIGMAIPANAALIGLTFYDQWLVAGTGCTFVSSDFSSAISATIQ